MTGDRFLNAAGLPRPFGLAIGGPGKFLTPWRLLPSHASAFSEARPGARLGVEPKVRARVRKSRQQEAAGAADAGLMQIEWSEGEMLKLGGVSTEAEEGGREGMGARIDIGKRCDREREVGSSVLVDRGRPSRASER